MTSGSGCHIILMIFSEGFAAKLLLLMKELEDDDGLDLTYWQSFVYLPSSRKQFNLVVNGRKRGVPQNFLAQNSPFDKRKIRKKGKLENPFLFLEKVDKNVNSILFEKRLGLFFSFVKKQHFCRSLKAFPMNVLMSIHF